MSRWVVMPPTASGFRNDCIDPILIWSSRGSGNSTFPWQQTVSPQQALRGLRKGDGLAQALVAGLERSALLLQGLPSPTECIAWDAAIW